MYVFLKVFTLSKKQKFQFVAVISEHIVKLSLVKNNKEQLSFNFEVTDYTV